MGGDLHQFAVRDCRAAGALDLCHRQKEKGRSVCTRSSGAGRSGKTTGRSGKTKRTGGPPTGLSCSLESSVGRLAEEPGRPSGQLVGWTEAAAEAEGSSRLGMVLSQ